MEEEPSRPRRGPPLDPRLLRESLAVRLYVAASVAIGAASAVLLVAQAVLLAGVIARVFLQGRGPLGARNGAALAGEWPALAWLAAIALARAALAWAAETAAHRTSARAKRDLRRRLARHVLAIGPARLGAEHTGELTLAATRGVDALDAYFARYLPQLVLSALVPLAVLAWVARTDHISAIILLATLPLVPLFGWLIGVASEAPARRQWRLLGSLAGHFLDVVQGLPTLRLFARSGAQAEHIARVSEEHRRVTMKTLRVAFLSAFALETVAAVATALVAVSIGLRLVDGRMTLAAGLAVLILTPEVFLPLRQASAQFHASAEGMAAADRIFEVLALDAPPALPALVPVPDPGGEPIRFEGVSLSYDGRARPALDGLTLAIHPGERVALTGPSGAGKSTVLALLARFAEPQGGTILVGDTELTAIPAAAWRERVAWVPQRPHLFRGTIDDNVRLARPGASVADVRRALDLAGASAFVDALPLGPATVLGERGVGLSAGQRQRIAVARAFLRDATLLLLDEPASALDPESEAELSRALQRLMAGRTVVVVAHTPALAAAADRVVGLEAGRVVQDATRHPEPAGPVLHPAP
jgi:thiol reductant ABC exporter CydD subunit